MKLFFVYLKQNLKIIFIFLLFCLIFFVSFLLYHLPLEAVIHPSFVCLILIAIFLCVDFRKVLIKHNTLLKMKKTGALMIDELPEISNIDDRDYQQIIRLLCEEQRVSEAAFAEKYDDMINYYTVWAHQIKTPISAMRLTLQNEDSSLSRKLSRELFKIEQYVEMVLTFLRLGSSSTDYVIKEYDLDIIVKQSVKKFAGEFIDRKIKLEYSPCDIKVVTDEKWLSFVIEQLLSNALKYTFEGSVKIYLKSPETLCIEDTGIGISPEDLPRIFENGYTGYNGRNDKKASGIGLYLCRRICKNLGHEISVSSVVGKGTTASLDLSRDNISKSMMFHAS